MAVRPGTETDARFHPYLEGDRVILRALAASDLDELAAAADDPELSRWTTVPYPYTRAHADAFLREVDAAKATGWAHVFAIRARATGDFVGIIDLRDIEPVSGRAEIGYWITAAHRRRGYAKDAIRCVLAIGTNVFGIERFVANVREGNAGSESVLRSHGFREDPDDAREHPRTRMPGAKRFIRDSPDAPR